MKDKQNNTNEVDRNESIKDYGTPEVKSFKSNIQFISIIGEIGPYHGSFRQEINQI